MFGADTNLKLLTPMKDSFWLFGSNLTILESEHDTDSSYDLIEGYFAPGAETPLHVHTKYTETMYVLEGEVTLYTPGNTHVLKKGESHFIPKNVPHTVVNNSKEHPFRALVVATPSGFAKLIREVGIPGSVNDGPPAQPNDMQLAMEVLEEIGDKNMGPPGARPE